MEKQYNNILYSLLIGMGLGIAYHLISSKSKAFAGGEETFQMTGPQATKHNGLLYTGGRQKPHSFKMLGQHVPTSGKLPGDPQQ